MDCEIPDRASNETPEAQELVFECVSHGAQPNSYLKRHKCFFHHGELQLSNKFILKKKELRLLNYSKEEILIHFGGVIRIELQFTDVAHCSSHQVTLSKGILESATAHVPNLYREGFPAFCQGTCSNQRFEITFESGVMLRKLIDLDQRYFEC